MLPCFDRPALRRLAFVASALLLTTCARTRTVHVSIGGPARFDLLKCVDNLSSRTPLTQRAIAARSITFVADYFATTAGINATSDVLLRACASGNCEPMPGRRAAFTLRISDIPVAPGASSVDWGRATMQALSRWSVTDNAPDSLVIMRVVATTQPESTVMQLDAQGRYPLLQTDALVGCAISPPVDFDTIESTVYLSLPVFGDPCVLSQVAFCAQGQ